MMKSGEAFASASPASITAIVPPSLCPSTPTLPKRPRPRRYAVPADASEAKSYVVALVPLPVDSPNPRSSYRSEAIPSRARRSAMTANGRCPASSSSRFCSPLPVTSSTTGVAFVAPSGTHNVPASVSPAAWLTNLTSSVVYPEGAVGVCGRAYEPSPGIMSSGNEAPPCVNMPDMRPSPICARYAAPSWATDTAIESSLQKSTEAGMDCSLWSGLFSVAVIRPSAGLVARSITMRRLPLTPKLSLPHHGPAGAATAQHAAAAIAAVRIYFFIVTAMIWNLEIVGMIKKCVPQL